jgi:AcrR family transcriptional regulator
MTQPEPTVASTRRRADAQLNRDKILTAAQAAFADPDADVSMAEIARRAGIGSATLYRNFADRRTLLEALYSAEITSICQAAETSEGVTPAARLDTWLRGFYDYFTHKRVLASELLEHVDGNSPVFNAGYARIIAAAGPLADAAHASGELRGDLTLEQILALIASVANIPGDLAYRAPILDASLDALRSRCQ